MNAKRYRSLLVILLALPCWATARDTASLRKQISLVADTFPGRLGVAVCELASGDTLTFNDQHRFPMQSVYKLPLALAILHRVDQGKLSLSQQVAVKRARLDPDTWSPIVRDFPAGDISLTLATLLRYTVSMSDNNGCDILFRLAGGTAVVNRYIHNLGVKGIAITATEAGMKKGWAVQYSNWCRPSAMLQLLRMLHKGNVLSPASTELLLQLMTASVNDSRIRGRLPEGAVVAHKTGTSDTNAQGIKAATNDVGILTMPGGRQVALVVYVSDYRGGLVRGEAVIAAIARMVWDHYEKP